VVLLVPVSAGMEPHIKTIMLYAPFYLKAKRLLLEVRVLFKGASNISPQALFLSKFGAYVKLFKNRAHLRSFLEILLVGILCLRFYPDWELIRDKEKISYFKFFDNKLKN